MKYPLLRLAHVPERFLQKRLYLDLRTDSPHKAPASVEIPQTHLRPAIPVLAD